MTTEGWRKAEKARENFGVAWLLLLAIAVVSVLLAMILSMALDLHGTVFEGIAFVSAVLSGVAYVIARLTPDRTPPEEVERRAQVRREAAMPGNVEAYQRIMSGERDEQETDMDRIHAMTFALKFEKELDGRLALAKSANTHEGTLSKLTRDESLDVQRAARETLGSPEFKERQAARNRAKEESARLEAKRRREEELERLAVEERGAEQMRLRDARSTDTPQDVLRSLATSDRSPEVRRAAIETLALLHQAGF